MTLETGRDIVRGILILFFTALSAWVDRESGLILLAVMGILILQSTFTGWCPADLFLRPMGLRSPREQMESRAT